MERKERDKEDNPTCSALASPPRPAPTPPPGLRLPGRGAKNCHTAGPRQLICKTAAESGRPEGQRPG
ncbi:hypothetical protein RRG08_037629 [Elysia crispata]|uniref:Uncharacterized protein n=1 Tax=Elysia crispata TaxID=231223 RepID=A0AAE0YGX8_9GAST|nr:hypothetical protein RRG08_037629 [Elysia crispata]